MTSLRVASWNINSVRLRLPLIAQFTEQFAPDVLCLQETKCGNDQFPEKRLKEFGFTYLAINGQKGHHGVATLSRVPIEPLYKHDFNGSGHARHVSVAVRPPGGRRKSLSLHNFYIPAGGDVPDRETNEKFDQKLSYLTAATNWFEGLPAAEQKRAILLGDLNIAPNENDVWSHKQLLNVVSHTAIEVDHLAQLQASLDWRDVIRGPMNDSEKIFTWWSYRARDWRTSNRGRRLDHVWATPDLEGAARSIEIVTDARGWEKPSDHVPVIVEFEI